MSFGPLFIQPTNSLAILLGGKSLEGIWARRRDGEDGEGRGERPLRRIPRN
jgi:hypothetical protein